MNNNSDFLNDSTKEREYFVSIFKSVQYYMIFKITTDESNKIIRYYVIRPANISLDKKF